jgi:ribosomal protein L11 methyltransferase
MFIEINFQPISKETKELLIASLSHLAEGFEEGDSTLKAFFKKNSFDKSFLQELVTTHQLQYTYTEIAPQNWNALWESNFDPVVVDDFVAVRAGFHEPIKNVQQEIIITPKMSFGTGHHATTYLMMQQMLNIDFKNKSVFDFGTGTGVLAILAAKFGATKIVATDLDEGSVENAQENFINNNIENITLLLSAEAQQGRGFDIILANINKNILMETIPQLLEQLNVHGTLLISGLLSHDENDIVAICEKNGITKYEKYEKNSWICLKMNKM